MTRDTARRTWLVTSVVSVALAICLRFVLYDLAHCGSKHVVSAVVVITLFLALAPYAVAFVYYGRILVWARRLARQEAASRGNRHFDGSVVLDNNIGPQEVS